MWQAEGRSVRLGHRPQRPSWAGRPCAPSTWLATGRAVAVLVSGLGVAAMALLLAPRVADGSLSGPLLALLVLLPLAVGEVASGLADAGALAVRSRAAADRLDALAARPPAVTDPSAPATLHDGDRVARRSVSPPPGTTGSPCATSTSSWTRATGWPWSGRPAPARAPWPACCSASSTRCGAGSCSATRRCRSSRWTTYDAASVSSTTTRTSSPPPWPRTSGWPGRTPPTPRSRAALRAARLGPWLDALPAGLGTWLGDGHAAVSGGERARLAIARSLARRPAGAGARRADRPPRLRDRGRDRRPGPRRRPRPHGRVDHPRRGRPRPRRPGRRAATGRTSA